MAEVLILGGTAEAAALARALAKTTDFVPITSLAGRTRAPAALPGEVRVGGFGGAERLAAYLRARPIAALVDATHPFATTISANAAAAAKATGTPRLMLLRPEWTPQEGEDWQVVGDEAAAAAALPAGARAFLALGHQHLAPFSARKDAWFLVRLIDAPDAPPLVAPHEVVVARGPFAERDEAVLFERHRIDHLVCRNSGGAPGRAKLDAARSFGIAVIMVARPPPPTGPFAASVAEAVDWLTALFPPRGPGA